jgi:hypothetical protein
MYHWAHDDSVHAENGALRGVDDWGLGFRV